jgi:cytoskeletal protein CcmA (bactofilin family)
MMTKNTKDTSPGSFSGTSGSSPSGSSKDSTIISKSILIKGEIAGEEDLTIQGRVEGTMKLRNNHVTVGQSGHLTGDLHGKLISVEGEVEGNLFAEEKIHLLPSAVVEGDMKAPVISLQEGAKFKGKIDMDTGGARQRSSFRPSVSPGSKHS